MVDWVGIAGFTSGLVLIDPVLPPPPYTWLMTISGETAEAVSTGSRLNSIARHIEK
jgi:hypothetical protein